MSDSAAPQRTPRASSAHAKPARPARKARPEAEPAEPAVKQKPQPARRARTATPPRAAAGHANEAAASASPHALDSHPENAGIRAAEQLFAGLANLAPVKLGSQVRSFAGQVMEWAGTAAEMAVGATAPLVKEPSRRAALARAGAVLRDARETAGMTASDVASALDLRDTNLLDLAESGRIALPFEVILRLASLLARNDPIPFVMNLTRVYNPGLWKVVEQLGVGKLALHVAREREFINIYRANDAARELGDEAFKLVLEFTAAAFASGVKLALSGQPKPARGKAPEAENKDRR